MRKRKDFIKQSTSKANETLKQRQRSSKKTQKKQISLLGWIARAPRRRQLLVHPFIKDFPGNIFIDNKEIRKHDLDLHTIVRVELQKSRGTNYEARVLEKFESIDDPELELQIVAESHGFPTEFSESVLQEAESNATRQDLKRTDLSNECIVTIDGETAKDFDDAILVQKRSSKEYRLLVCIADVSFFIDAKSKLDQEAYERGTSIYFPGFVVPMLPEALSNHICSLVPHQKRYTISCDMIIDSKGKIKGTRIYPSIIQSKARLTYTQVSNYYEGKPEVLLPEVASMLDDARELAQILQESRMKKGYLDLDLPELEMEVNARGDVLKIGHALRTEAHRLIESFMVIANEAVSEAIEEKGYPSIFRVHEEPDPLKLERFASIVKAWGFKLPGRVKMTDIQAFLESIKGHAQEKMLALSLLRSLKQAQYTAANVGHFGLGSESYCHFTSPIRRYPDLMIHRILRESGFLKRSKSRFHTDQLEKIAQQCSDREHRAVMAERDLKAMKKARFMEAYVGKEFDAFIVSVKDFGFFIEIVPFGCEGLVPLRTLPYDYWKLDELEIELSGRKSGKTYRLGDRIRVRVLEVDRLKHQISFQYLSHLSNKG